MSDLMARTWLSDYEVNLREKASVEQTEKQLADEFARLEEAIQRLTAQRDAVQQQLGAVRERQSVIDGTCTQRMVLVLL